MKSKKVITVLKIIAALIMLQTLYFKFTGAPESIYIYEKTGLGTAGRIGTGIGELIASVLLLIPATAWIGAVIGLGLMSGAIVSHLTILGIAVMDDNGQLFIYGVIVFVICAVVLFSERNHIFHALKTKFNI